MLLYDFRDKYTKSFLYDNKKACYFFVSFVYFVHF